MCIKIYKTWGGYQGLQMLLLKLYVQTISLILDAYVSWLSLCNEPDVLGPKSILPASKEIHEMHQMSVLIRKIPL